jgi:hypothetical protein
VTGGGGACRRDVCGLEHYLRHQLHILDELHVGGLGPALRGVLPALLRKQGPPLVVEEIKHGLHSGLEVPEQVRLALLLLLLVAVVGDVLIGWSVRKDREAGGGGGVGEGEGGKGGSTHR